MEKREHYYIVGGKEDWYSHCGKQYGISSKKLQIRLLFYLAIPLLGLYPKYPETPIQKNLCTPIAVYSSTIYNSQVLEAT